LSLQERPEEIQPRHDYISHRKKEAGGKQNRIRKEEEERHVNSGRKKLEHMRPWADGWEPGEGICMRCVKRASGGEKCYF